MRHNPDYALEDLEAIKDLITAHPWCTFVGHTPAGLVASHYPVILEEQADDDDALVLLSHVGRPDEAKLGLGGAGGSEPSELLAIIQGPHGYISPSWYGYRPNVPTWNFAAAHLYGVPEVLSDAENLEVLHRLVAHFEIPLPDPHLLDATDENSDYARRIVRGTVGFRLRVTRFEAKEKMSQDKPMESVRQIIEELRGDGPYADPALADRMARVNAAGLDDLALKDPALKNSSPKEAAR
ncbi:FMN-binding negative transcriptional regulator [Nesterenkonia sandarakina]|uniref:PaiB family negative transcriptional regulator n=1 Tax=Nesterenkonia sandarakina TaxID=272918 RepID=A0A2T0YQ96_9MICC|nr:FMN-binding negative transcriptional regulator [Nesterenkonia sandarakina]PRZ17560.1 PaiB family negative transcriptional regulator [Nesterenkonia sandarakina]